MNVGDRVEIFYVAERRAMMPFNGCQGTLLAVTDEVACVEVEIDGRRVPCYFDRKNVRRVS